MNAFQWHSDNRIRLLENGDEFFPRVFDVIRQARHEVFIETFILFEDKVGKALQAALIEVAQKGVRVELTVDGYGSPDLSDEFISAMTSVGVYFRIFDPQPKLLGMRTNIFRRLHRKLVVVDGRIAFVGGINYSADHLLDFGPTGKQDYAVEVEGPVVDDIRRFIEAVIVKHSQHPLWLRGVYQHFMSLIPRNAETNHTGDSDVLFVIRDNDRNRTDIERQYRLAIRDARRDIIIANAYFFPGYRLFRQLRNAARRGVKVRLILQGIPDMPLAQFAARLLYEELIKAGVHISEYCTRPFHGKVAVIDDAWATVGSSNLDPLSLSLNLEANVIIHDRAFNKVLREKLERHVINDCEEMDDMRIKRRIIWRWVPNFLVYHLIRNFPSWAGWLPAHTPSLTLVSPSADTCMQQSDKQHHFE